jgi:hypothetical protein
MSGGRRIVLFAGHGAEDPHTGSAQVDRTGSVVRERRELVAAVRRGDAENVGRTVAARVPGNGVVVGAVVPGREDEECVHTLGSDHRVSHKL